MNTRILGVALLVCAVGVLTLTIGADVALAKSSDIGKNVGDEIETWAKAILFGLIGLCAIPILIKRDVGGGLVLMVLGVVIGGFVFAESAVQDIIKSLWKSIGG